MRVDEVVIVATPDLANLRNTKNLLDTLAQLRPNDVKPHLVLNQMGIPKRPEIALADFAEPLGIDPIATIDFDPQRMVLMAALEAIFYFYAAGSLIAYMVEDEFATADELFAAGATFTLLAWAFAFVFVVCQAAVPESFTALERPGSPRTWIELLFLSFTTLSGVGLGDILPLAPMARALVMIEEFTGVMYLAVVVSRLIALSCRIKTA